MISRGGGVKKKRKAMGKARACRVFVLNRMRTSPVMKTGRESMWYSRGVKA